MNDNALRSAHLVKHYGRRRVVDDVSLQVGQGEVVGDHGPCEHRRVSDVEAQPGVGHRPPAAERLRLALGRERHVVPPGEEVLEVPRALAVAQQDEGSRHDAES